MPAAFRPSSPPHSAGPAPRSHRRFAAVALTALLVAGGVGSAARAAGPIPGVPVETPPVPALPPEAAPVQNVLAPGAFAVCVSGLSAVIVGTMAVGLATALTGVAPVPVPVPVPVPLSPATLVGAAAIPLGLSCQLTPIPEGATACPLPAVGEPGAAGLPLPVPDPAGILVDTLAAAEYEAGAPSAPSSTLETEIGCSYRPF